jgi:hypothetical protein
MKPKEKKNQSGIILKLDFEKASNGSSYLSVLLPEVLMRDGANGWSKLWLEGL